MFRNSEVGEAGEGASRFLRRIIILRDDNATPDNPAIEARVLGELNNADLDLPVGKRIHHTSAAKVQFTINGVSRVLDLPEALEKVNAIFKEAGANAKVEAVHVSRVTTKTPQQIHVESGRVVEGAPFWIGVELNEIPEAVRQHLKLDEGQGLMIDEVFDGSPAAKAGLAKLDLVLIVNGQGIAQAQDLQKAVQQAGRQSRPVELIILRQGRKQSIVVKPVRRELRMLNFSTNAPGSGADLESYTDILFGIVEQTEDAPIHRVEVVRPGVRLTGKEAQELKTLRQLEVKEQAEREALRAKLRQQDAAARQQLNREIRVLRERLQSQDKELQQVLQTVRELQRLATDADQKERTDETETDTKKSDD